LPQLRDRRGCSRLPRVNELERFTEAPSGLQNGWKQSDTRDRFQLSRHSAPRRRRMTRCSEKGGPK
jgi:hypothetical protein